MRWIVLVVLVGALAACGGPDDKGGASDFSAAQKIVDDVAAGHADLDRLTLHAVPTGKTDCTQVASTMASRRGKVSDPEDLKALSTGEEVLLDEDGKVDLTVPILKKDGKATAVAGVTMLVKEGADHDAVVAEARAVAQELEAAVQAAGKPVW